MKSPLLALADQVGTQLKMLRQAQGLTQAQLGARVGIGQARVAEIEARPGVVSLDQVMQILAALGAGLVIQQHAAEPKGRENKGAW